MQHSNQIWLALFICRTGPDSLEFTYMSPDREITAQSERELLERAALLRARTLVDRTRSLYRELEQRTGVPVQVHRALGCIAGDPGIQSSQLALQLGMQRSTVSHLLKTLAAKGWIDRRRSDSDQRSVHLHVTASGRGIVGATSGRVVGVLQRAVQSLSDVQLAELDRSLAALLQQIEKPAPEPVNAARRGRASAGTPRKKQRQV